RHGQGYTRFEHVSHGISLELLQLVPLDDPIKISRLTLTNESGRPRRLSVTAYVEWVLGVSRPTAAPFVVTEIDGQTGAMLARNGSPDHPSALAARHRLSGRVGAGLDPCGALQATLALPARGRAEVVFLLG